MTDALVMLQFGERIIEMPMLALVAICIALGLACLVFGWWGQQGRGRLPSD